MWVAANKKRTEQKEAACSTSELWEECWCCQQTWHIDAKMVPGAGPKEAGH